MKKHQVRKVFAFIVLSLVLLVALHGCQGAAIATKGCYDSDGTTLSQNDPSYAVRGNVAVFGGDEVLETFHDSCEGETLTEYYCKGNSKRKMKINCLAPCSTKSTC
mgnify:CR=1 FL=1